MTEKPEGTLPSQKLRTEVAEALSSSGAKVRGLVIDKLTQDEIEKRTKSVLTVLEKVEAKHNELRKLERSGTTNFDASGAEIGAATYTKAQVEEMKKMREGIGKLQNLLEKAFEAGEFAKLHEAANQN